MAGLQAPLSTLRLAPRDALRMTRGQRGLLFLYFWGFSPFSLCVISRRTSVQFFPFGVVTPVCAQPGRHSLKPTLKGYFYTNLVGTLHPGTMKKEPDSSDDLDLMILETIDEMHAEAQITRTL